MTSLLQEEKQLFDKFWKGTFKAVATPRPESVIIASITARREANRLETSLCVPAKPSETKSVREEQEVKETERKRHRKHRGHKRHSRRRRRRCHSVSLDADFSPRPVAKAKKKKKKSVRKRRRERCHSSSPSPLRKKKKKKKSSKKRKQHSSTSKKRRHSSFSTRRKRKEDRKHKKRRRIDSHHRRRSRRANSSDWRSSSTESRCEDGSKSGFQRSSHAAVQEGFEWCSTVKLATKIPSKCMVVHSRPGLETSVVQDSSCIQGKGRADYDSGNDTSSPPSSKTGVSRVQVTADRQEKLKFTDNSSDSGNSLSSYESLRKAEREQERHVHTSAFNKLKGEESSSCVGFLSHRSQSAVKYPYRSETRSRSRSRSARSSRHWGRHASRSRSPSSSRRSYSRSSSYSCDSRRGNGKHSRYTPDRTRGSRRRCSSCGKPWKRSRKHSRRRSCSPMRKRRRDSPSHLEARRITSARKRPIPYYRPSPSSSSSRASSLSSWSLFSLNRSQSRSPVHSRRSRSSYRNYSRSTSLSSIYSSRSDDSLASYNRARR